MNIAQIASKAVSGTAIAIALISTGLGCLLVLVFALFSGMDPAYPPRGVDGIFHAYGQTAHRVVSTMAVSVALFVAAIVILLVAIARHGTAWTNAGTLLTAGTGLTLVMTFVMGVNNLHDATAFARSLVDQELSETADALADTPAAITEGVARTEMGHMLARTLAASVGEPVDESGDVIVAAGVPMDAEPCDAGGRRFVIALSLASDDNAATAEGILKAWDDEQYWPDAAMQELRRYRTDRPVEQLLLHDRTTLTGLIDIRIQSACFEPAS